MTMTQIIPTQQHDAAKHRDHIFVFFDAVGLGDAVIGVSTTETCNSLFDGLVVICTVRGCCATAICLFFLLRLVLFVFFGAGGLGGAPNIGAPTTKTCDSMFDGLVVHS